MTRQQLPRILGTHGFRGPDGEIRVSDISVNADGDRTFNVDYVGARATCAAPGGHAPFACSLVVENGTSWRLEVGPGCTDGKVTVTSAEGGTPKSLLVRTDVLETQGEERPSREVALLDDKGVLAFSDSPGGDLFVLTRPDAKLGPFEFIALVAVQTYASTQAPSPSPWCKTQGS